MLYNPRNSSETAFCGNTRRSTSRVRTTDSFSPNTIPACRTPLHVEWIQSFYSLFKAMIAYVKQHHPTGLVWNNKSGVDAKQALAQIQSSSSSSSSSSANGTRPVSRVPTSGSAPPPPPPLPKFDNSVTLPSVKDTKSTGGDMNDVFSQLNQGEAVTSSLRRVDKSEMTHKNPSLRSSAIIPGPQRSASSSSGGAPNKKPKPEGMRTKKPARKELDGNKWIVVRRFPLTSSSASYFAHVLTSHHRSTLTPRPSP